MIDAAPGAIDSGLKGISDAGSSGALNGALMTAVVEKPSSVFSARDERARDLHGHREPGPGRVVEIVGIRDDVDGRCVERYEARAGRRRAPA